MVEQSMKRRSEAGEEEEEEGGGRGGLRMLWKTFLTWEGSGRTVTMTSCALYKQLATFSWLLKRESESDDVRGLALMWNSNQRKGCMTRAPNLDHWVWNMLIIRKRLMIVKDKSRTAFSATTLGELAISMPIRPMWALFEAGLSLAMPTSCMKLAVASLLRSCMINVSLAGIFARMFLAIGYPDKARSHL